MLSLNPAILTLYEEDYKTTSPDLVSPQTFFLWLRVDPLRRSGHILAMPLERHVSGARAGGGQEHWKHRHLRSSASHWAVGVQIPVVKKNAAPQVPCPFLHRRRGCWAARCGGQPCVRIDGGWSQTTSPAMVESRSCHKRATMSPSLFFWTPCPRRSPTPVNSCESEIDSTGFCKCSPPPEPSCNLSSAQTRGRPASICHCCQSLELMRNMSFPEPCHLDTHTTLRVTQVSYCPPLRQSRMWSAAMRADRSMGDEVWRRGWRWWNPDPVMEGPLCHQFRFFSLGSNKC